LIAAGLAVFPSPRSPAPLDDRAGHTARKVAAAGRVEPYSEAIEFAVGLNGALKAVYVAEGDGVRIGPGPLLAELDNADQRARVAQAEATVRLSQAELQKLMVGARAEEPSAVAAQLDEAAANLSFANKRARAP
jgi:multidrug efflux pump subunit AcrA (membrane-fusion protein)